MVDRVSSSTDRIREVREALKLFRVRDARIAQDIVEAAARSFVEGELPPDFPSEADVEAATRNLNGDDDGMWGLSEIEPARVRAALAAVAESRRTAHLLPGDET